MRVLGVKSIKQFCYEDLTDLVLPWSTLLDKKNEEVEMPSDPRFQIAQHMDTFTKRVAQVNSAPCPRRGLSLTGMIAIH